MTVPRQVDKSPLKTGVGKEIWRLLFPPTGFPIALDGSQPQPQAFGNGLLVQARLAKPSHLPRRGLPLGLTAVWDTKIVPQGCQRRELTGVLPPRGVLGALERDDLPGPGKRADPANRLQDRPHLAMVQRSLSEGGHIKNSMARVGHLGNARGGSWAVRTEMGTRKSVARRSWRIAPTTASVT